MGRTRRRYSIFQFQEWTKAGFQILHSDWSTNHWKSGFLKAFQSDFSWKQRKHFLEMEDEIMETWDKVGNNVEGKTDFLFDGLAWSNNKVRQNYDVIPTSSQCPF